MTRYRFVDARKAEGFPVVAACQVAGVSTSSYYDWVATVAAGPSTREWDEALVVNEMRDVHAHHDDTYGVAPDDDRAGTTRVLPQPQAHRASDGRERHRGERRPAQTSPHDNPRRHGPAASRPRAPGLLRRRARAADLWGHHLHRNRRGLALSRFGAGPREPTVDRLGHGRANALELCRDAIDMAVSARCGDVAGMLFHHDRGSPSNISPRTSGHTVVSSASPNRSAASARATTTARRSRSGRHSSASSPAASASRPVPRPGTRSPPGSSTTTPPGCTARSGTSRRSSGS